MTTQTKAPPHSSSALELPLRRFTVAEYYAMAEAGILTEDDRVELLDGVIVDMAPIGDPHAGTVDIFTWLLSTAVAQRAVLRVQGPLAVDGQSRLQPDLMLLRERPDFYRTGTPRPEDVLLLIEVADSSVDYDRGEKLPRYARAGIPEVWITVLPERIVEAHTEPADGRYTVRRTYAPGDTITPGYFPDITLPVSEILPG